MTYDYTFGLDLPELKKIISTEQFELSEELMDLRYELGVSEEEMAKITNFSLQEYLLMEFGMEDVNVSQYKQAISNAKKYIESIKRNNLTHLDIVQKYSNPFENCYQIKNEMIYLKFMFDIKEPIKEQEIFYESISKYMNDYYNKNSHSLMLKARYENFQNQLKKYTFENSIKSKSATTTYQNYLDNNQNMEVVVGT